MSEEKKVEKDERGEFQAWAKEQGRRFNEGDLQNAKSWALAAWMARAAAQQDEPSTGICFFCGEPINGEHESDCPQAARAASTSDDVAQGEKRDAKSDRYFLVVENGSYLIVDRERSEMRGDEPDYFVLAWTPNKDDAKFVCDVMNGPAQRALTGDARECLADVVSHYRALYAGLAFQLNEATVSENSDDMTYWKHEIKALERMYEQAERALTAAQSGEPK